MTVRLTIFEGARGGGKSTISQRMRQSVSHTTLVNFTGFSDRGSEGLGKVWNYYANWMAMLMSFQKEEDEYHFICDRFFFSERVFSKLYKDYDFGPAYEMLLKKMASMSRVDIFFLKVLDENVLENRLIRDKVPFANVKESARESLRQQEEYEAVFRDIIDRNFLGGNINIYNYDTSDVDADGVYYVVMSQLGYKVKQKGICEVCGKSGLVQRKFRTDGVVLKICEDCDQKIGDMSELFRQT